MDLHPDVAAPVPDLTALGPLRDAVAARSAADTAVARASEVLRRGVVTGVLRAGTRLPEEALAAELEVSRNTLRAAFDELEQEHLVIRRRHRGVQVVVPDAATMHETYRHRLALEGAALRWPEQEVHSQAVALMREAVHRGRAARETEDVPAMAEANDAFHRAVVSLSGSSRQLELMDRALAEVRLIFHTLDENPVFHSPWVERNASILERVEQRRNVEAADLIGTYLSDSRRSILEQWDRISTEIAR